MKKNQQNSLYQDLILNLALPSLALEYLNGSRGLGSPLMALSVGVTFPLISAALELRREGKLGLLPMLGLINTLFSGGFALVSVNRHWFPYKESALPLIIALLVFATLFSEKTAFERMIENQDELPFKDLKESEPVGMKKIFTVSTLMLALSFTISSLLNFLLAQKVFVDPYPPITPELDAQLLNSQLSEMNWKGFVILFVPNIAMMMGIALYFMKQTQKLRANHPLQKPSDPEPSTPES